MRAAHLASVVCLTLAVAVSACSGGGTPVSPSRLGPLSAPASGAGIGILDDEPPAEGTPGEGTPPGEGMPLPVTINIIGSIGTGAFDPNPIQAMLGDLLVWLNNDLRTHHLFLEDGTDLGIVLPGESTLPVALTTESASYYCSLHPSMFGVINRELPPMYEDPYPEYRVRIRKP